MASILVVCTGNVCRSPIAEGFVKAALGARFGDRAPSVASAGTAGWEGSGADPGSVAAAAERGVDIAAHRARRVGEADLRGATLILAMAREHRDAVGHLTPDVADRAFTLKELVRLLEALPDPGPAESEPGPAIAARVADAEALRGSGFEGNAHDEDVADPLGLPLEVFRAVAWELEEWCGRLVDGLFGRTRARAAAERE